MKTLLTSLLLTFLLVSDFLRSEPVPIFPPSLEKGDTIAVVAPASCPEEDQQTVARWRRRFAAHGLGGIEKDAPRGGRKPTRRDRVARRIVEKTTQEPPPNATHWSTRTLAGALGVSHMMVHRVWQANGLKPHLTRNFKVSNDPRFAEKLMDVVGLYLNPPEHALVLLVMASRRSLPR